MNMAMVGVSIMVRKPLDISDIILAILVLGIVYCNGNVWGGKVVCKLFLSSSLSC
jgi:hypothetical protein